MPFKIPLKPSHCLNVDQRGLFMIYINILIIIFSFWILHHPLPHPSPFFSALQKVFGLAGVEVCHPFRKS